MYERVLKNRPAQISLAFILGLIGISSLACAEDLGSADLSRIHSTYENNQARFFRDFAGKRFSAKMPVAKIIESPIFRGTFSVYFGENEVNAEVECEFSDPGDVAQVSDLNKGEVLNVIGTVKDHYFGAVTLKDCSISHPAAPILPDTSVRPGTLAAPAQEPKSTPSPCDSTASPPAAPAYIYVPPTPVLRVPPKEIRAHAHPEWKPLKVGSREFNEIQESCSTLPSAQVGESWYQEREAYDWAVANRTKFPKEKYPELSAKRISCWSVAKAGDVLRFTRYKNCVSSGTLSP
jgi:hypothetical protein